jgi:excisionase family DNA binding protein
LTVKEAADYLQLSASRIYNLVFEKKLQPNQRTKRCRITFSVEQLNNYLSQSNETEFLKNK